MVYFAELLVVMTDRLKIVRIRARNVPRTRTQALIDDDAFLASLSRSRKRRCRVLMRRGAVLLTHLKNRLQTTCACLAVASRLTSRKPLWLDLQPVDIKSRWRHNWKSAQVVNSHLVCDPTIRQSTSLGNSGLC